MSNKKTWLITGAGRGMGVDSPKPRWWPVTRSSPTGRNTNAVAKAVGQSNDLQAVKLDVTSRAGGAGRFGCLKSSDNRWLAASRPLRNVLWEVLAVSMLPFVMRRSGFDFANFFAPSVARLVGSPDHKYTSKLPKSSYVAPS